MANAAGSSSRALQIESRTPGLLVGWHDLALADLSPALRDAVEEAPIPWLNSLGFCTMYEPPFAERVAMQIGPDGSIEQAAFYRERKLAGIIRLLQFSGYPDVADGTILEILASRRAHLAVVYRIEPPHQTTTTRTHRPAFEFSHNVIVDLPQTKSEYLQSLGKQKRQQLPRYWRKLQREFNDQVDLRFTSTSAIRFDQVVQLIQFNQSRMASLGKEDHSEAEAKKQQRRWPFAESLGLLCTIESQGRLLGGTFNYVHRDEAFLMVIAHDPQLERLNIGHLGLWKTAEHLIDLGVRRYHLFWGKTLYKTQFGGVDHPIVAVTISKYRLLEWLWRVRLIAGRQVPRAVRYVMRRIRRPPPARPA